MIKFRLGRRSPFIDFNSRKGRARPLVRPGFLALCVKLDCGFKVGALVSVSAICIYELRKKSIVYHGGGGGYVIGLAYLLYVLLVNCFAVK